MATKPKSLFEQMALLNVGSKSRRPRRVLMRVVDAGEPDGCERGAHVVYLECPKCGFQSGAVQVRSVTEGKHQPCPDCNAQANSHD